MQEMGQIWGLPLRAGPFLDLTSFCSSMSALEHHSHPLSEGRGDSQSLWEGSGDLWCFQKNTYPASNIQRSAVLCGANVSALELSCFFFQMERSENPTHMPFCFEGKSLADSGPSVACWIQYHAERINGDGGLSFLKLFSMHLSQSAQASECSCSASLSQNTVPGLWQCLSPRTFQNCYVPLSSLPSPTVSHLTQ